MAVNFFLTNVSIPGLNKQPQALTPLSESERAVFLSNINIFNVVFVKGFIRTSFGLQEILYSNSSFYHLGSSKNFSLNFVVAYDNSLSYEENFLYSPIFSYSA